MLFGGKKIHGTLEEIYLSSAHRESGDLSRERSRHFCYCLTGAWDAVSH